MIGAAHQTQDSQGCEARLRAHQIRWRESTTDPVETRAHALTISRAAGARGEEVARRLARILDLPYYDRELVGLLVGTPELQRDAAQILSPRRRARVDAMVRAFLDGRSLKERELARKVVRSVLLLWEHGSCVICGFGCVHVVPRDRALALRLTAPARERALGLAAEQQLDEAAAQRAIYRTDAEREAYHRRFFGANLVEPDHFDLVIDTSQLGEEGSAIVAAEAFYRKFRGRS